MALPLAGIKVLDIARTVAGPFCAQLLSEMGAEVIKVEAPGTGDESRSWMPLWNGHGSVFLAFNRNKRGVTLNLKDPRGRELLLRLVRDADVLIENFRTGLPEKLGVTYAELSAANPRLIHTAVTAFGRTGPMKDRPGYDAVLQAFGGMMSVTGEPGGDPVRVGFPVIDLMTGSLAYGATLTALRAREATGRGQYVEVSLLEAALTVMSYFAIDYQATGEAPRAWGSALKANAPYQAFATADSHVFLAVANDSLWQRFCRGVGLEHLMEDPRFRINADRVRNRSELIPLVTELMRTRTTAQWLQVLDEAGVPCAPVNKVPDVLASPQVAHLGAFLPLPHPDIPDLRVIGAPFRLSEGGTPERTPPPRLGQHTAEVLEGLGLSAAEIAGLKAEGVI